MVFDTNVLIYGADESSEHHVICQRLLSSWDTTRHPAYLTWSICYEFLRVVTHPRVFHMPWTTARGWQFLEHLIFRQSFQVLAATEFHWQFLAQTLDELPDIRGNRVHDLHIAVLMREHGITEICTMDGDFRRFPFLKAVDPLGLEPR